MYDDYPRCYVAEPVVRNFFRFTEDVLTSGEGRVMTSLIERNLDSSRTYLPYNPEWQQSNLERRGAGIIEKRVAVIIKAFPNIRWAVGHPFIAGVERELGLPSSREYTESCKGEGRFDYIWFEKALNGRDRKERKEAISLERKVNDRSLCGVDFIISRTTEIQNLCRAYGIDVGDRMVTYPYHFADYLLCQRTLDREGVLEYFGLLSDYTSLWKEMGITLRASGFHKMNIPKEELVEKLVSRFGGYVDIWEQALVAKRKLWDVQAFDIPMLWEHGNVVFLPTVILGKEG